MERESLSLHKFNDAILVEYHNEKWTVMRELSFYFMIEGKKKTVVIPKGFGTDFASTPRILYPFLPPTGKHNRAALAHDYLYSTGRYSRKHSDQAFYQLLGACKVNKTISELAYWGVRLGGKKRYLASLESS